MNTCAMCSKPTPADYGLLCEYHRRQDDKIKAMVAAQPVQQAKMGDECGCVVCRSDLVGIVGCEAD